jgi:hypothetical protein
VGGVLASPSSWRYAQSSWPASVSIENSSHPVSEVQQGSSRVLRAHVAEDDAGLLAVGGYDENCNPLA